MIFTADQIVAHLLGDYVFQSHWMATEKTKRWWPACCHAMVYSLTFQIAFSPSWPAYMAIFFTHFCIDRWRLARYVVWVKNCLGAGNPPWGECRATGFPPDTPPWLAVWLLIIVDNILHIVINGLCLKYL